MSSAPLDIGRSDTRSRITALGPVLVVVWLLMFVTFSAPDRDDPQDAGSLDIIALAKLAVRGLSLVVLANAIWNTPSHARKSLARILAPWLVFLGWAILSVLWSPLKSFSAGQAGSLLVLGMLTFALALLVRNEDDLRRVLQHLCLALFAVSSFLVVVRFVAPEISGLLRGDVASHSGGIVHPTSAGATASLGILLLVLCRVFWDWSWSRSLLVPGLLVHTLLMFFAASRTAMAVTFVVLALLFLVWLPNWFARLSVAGGILGACWLMLDPAMLWTEQVLGMTSGYVSRGESLELLLTLTGRTELWDAIWTGFWESPLIGHGYFVTTPTGLVDVWSGPSIRTAHNLFLQVLVSTGIVGFVIYLWGGARVIRILGQRLTRPERPLGNCLLLVGLWYLGWSQMCASFMGPIQPEAVAFFLLLGVGLGFASTKNIDQPERRSPEPSTAV